MEGSHLLKMYLLFANGAFPLSFEIFVFFLSHSGDFQVNHVNLGGGQMVSQEHLSFTDTDQSLRYLEKFNQIFHRPIFFFKKGKFLLVSCDNRLSISDIF